MTQEHTPGPWSAVSRGGILVVGYGDQPRADFVCQPNEDLPEAEANACLMAAAPDLLAASKMLAALEHPDNGRSFPTAEQCAFARAAIAKALPLLPR